MVNELLIIGKYWLYENQYQHLLNIMYHSVVRWPCSLFTVLDVRRGLSCQYLRVSDYVVLNWRQDEAFQWGYLDFKIQYQIGLKRAADD